jgi:hypothetical protein
MDSPTTTTRFMITNPADEVLTDNLRLLDMHPVTFDTLRQALGGHCNRSPTTIRQWRAGYESIIRAFGNFEGLEAEVLQLQAKLTALETTRATDGKYMSLWKGIEKNRRKLTCLVRCRASTD